MSILNNTYVAQKPHRPGLNVLRRLHLDVTP